MHYQHHFKRVEIRSTKGLGVFAIYSVALTSDVSSIYSMSFLWEALQLVVGYEKKFKKHSNLFASISSGLRIGYMYIRRMYNGFFSHPLTVTRQSWMALLHSILITLFESVFPRQHMAASTYCHPEYDTEDSEHLKRLSWLHVDFGFYIPSGAFCTPSVRPFGFNISH